MLGKKLKIACFGEAMVELSLGRTGQDARVGFAGDTLNTAIYLRRGLPEAYQVDFVSVVGADPLSDRMLNFIESESVGTAHIRRHPTRMPGLYAITTDAAGERSFSYWRSESAARTLFTDDDGADFDALWDYDLIYYSAITLAILPPRTREALFSWIEKFRAKGGEVAFDTNYRPRLWEDVPTARAAVETAWRHCDVAFPSADDEIDLFGDADTDAVLARVNGYGITCGALKRGGDGPAAIGRILPAFLPEFRRVRMVVDTTAAGDSFVGGYLSKYAQGRPLDEALAEGHAVACRVIGEPGAIVPLDRWLLEA